MKPSKLLLTTILLSGGLTTFAAENQIGTGENDGYTLVWQDLFDGTDLDPMRWTIEVNGNGGGNNELQY